MHEYEYWLHDGTHGYVYAEKYQLEKTEYVFYRGKIAVYRIPSEWLAKPIEKVY